ncbi:MAG: SUMF1/EgtB/PvdO family nonheme iron enzyme [Treponema sp.]|jgi:formylglycine-generating enzyme required for sulfatase activity|nr:SUMF1/EgtB/PvdO family nonheme iron enzyme [Treponema sp.]
MRGKIQADNTYEPDDQVRLKPKLGLRPGVYLAIIYGFVILLVLYFILLHPGLSKPGAVVVFTSEPWGAALRVDGVYAGTSPCRVFVPKGRRDIEVVLPGFSLERVEAEIPGRVFASLLFPRRFPLYVRLAAAEPLKPLEIASSEFAAWSFGPEPTASWQIPMVLSEGVYCTGSASVNTGRILSASARFAVTRASIRDLVRAENLSANGGNAASPLSLIRSVSDIVSFLDDNAGAAAWLADTLPQEPAALLVSSSWYENQLAGHAAIIAQERLSAPPGESVMGNPPLQQIRVAGLMFTGLNGGSLAQMEPFPHLARIEPFMICSTPVPTPAFMDFLDANPQWGPDQRETLKSRGLATNEYLADFEAGTGRVITGINAVSWYAARAFCEWLGTKLPDSLSDYTVRLPTESEWEYAVKSVEQWGRKEFLVKGNMWEWCGNPYSHLPFISAPPEAIAAVGSPEYPLRGGSLLNAVTPGNPETRASLPPESCSPFVSFRPVIVRKGS